MMITFEIPGEPMGKQRARTVTGHTYTPEKTVNYETLVKEMFWLSHGQKLEGPISIVVTACFSIPASKSNKQKLAMAQDEIKPTKKPDCDNILKIVCDALNKIAYDDDSQIVYARVRKLYSNTPKVIVALSERGYLKEGKG